MMFCNFLVAECIIECPKINGCDGRCMEKLNFWNWEMMKSGHWGFDGSNAEVYGVFIRNTLDCSFRSNPTVRWRLSCLIWDWNSLKCYIMFKLGAITNWFKDGWTCFVLLDLCISTVEEDSICLVYFNLESTRIAVFTTVYWVLNWALEIWLKVRVCVFAPRDVRKVKQWV